MRKIYVCYVNHGFIHHCLETSFFNEQDAQKWRDARNAQIAQITGLKRAAESRYRNPEDKEKYEQVLAEATAFERRLNLHKDTWLADYEELEVS